MKKTILVFGAGILQESLIRRAQDMGLFVVGVDPCEDAYCKNVVDVFEVVGGQDFEGTMAVAKKYNVSAVVTTATDKPLVMMARVAKELGLRFFSEETAIVSTDKFLMKERFMANGIPCAKGKVISTEKDASDMVFPVIVKPRDNSGSRGVKLCNNLQELEETIQEALDNSKKDTVLVEEFIEGREFSIEALHYDGKSEVIQFTEKKTTPFPYNVELGHIQPANLPDTEKDEIRSVINRIAQCMNFENCASHTELKVNERGIFIIETSPRLGGDYITSILTPLSTGVNIEEQLLHIVLGELVDIKTGYMGKASAVCFLSLPEGKVTAIDGKINEVSDWPHIQGFQLNLNVGDHVNKITSSLNRYGQFIVAGSTRREVDELVYKYNGQIKNLIIVS